MNTAAVTRESSTQQIQKQWKSSAQKPSGEDAGESARFSGVLKPYLESPKANQGQDQAQDQDRAHAHAKTQEKETKRLSRENDSALSEPPFDCDCSSETVPNALIQMGVLNVLVPGEAPVAQSKTALHSVTEAGLNKGRCEAVPELATIPASSTASGTVSGLASEPAPGAALADGMTTAESDVILSDILQANVTKNQTESMHPAENSILEDARQRSASVYVAPDPSKEAEKGEQALTLASGKAPEDDGMLKTLMADAKKSIEHESQVQPGALKNSSALDSAKLEPGDVTSTMKNNTDLTHSPESARNHLAAKEALLEVSASNIKTHSAEAALVTPSLTGLASENGAAIMTMPGSVRIAALPELMAEQAQLIREGETNALRLHLNPEHLGSLKIELSLKNGILTGVISVESELAHELLQKQLPQLLSTLDSRHIPTGTFEMHYRGDNDGFPNHADQGSRQHQDAYRGKEEEKPLAYGLHASAESDAHKRLDLLA